MAVKTFLTNEDAQIIDNKIERLSEEIGKKEKPLVYIDGTIPTTKDSVLATVTVRSKWLNLFAYIKIKCQGSSSMEYPKKNFTVTLFEDEARTIPLYVTIPGWKHASNKFVLKANYIDRLHARNIISARLWSEIVASRPDYDTMPEELRNSPNNGAIDGFPIIVYTNGNYQGLYTWNIGKDAWLWGMNEDNPNHVLMCAENNTDGVYAEIPCNFRALWSGVNESYWSVEAGTNSDAVKNALNALITCVKDTTDEEFMAQIDTYLDLQSAIDYYLFSCANCGIDNLGKNMLLGTYDLRKWILGQYDLDSTWGLWWAGTQFIPADTVCPDDYQEAYSLLFERITNLCTDWLVQRGRELRNNVLSVANITTHFERYAAEIGAEAYMDDLVVYSNIPSAESNNIWQIRNFVKDRLAYFDSWLDGMTEPNDATPYPLKDGVYQNVEGNMRIEISGGNHVKIESEVDTVYADLTNCVIDSTNMYKYDVELFGLNAGDVVKRTVKNIVLSNENAAAIMTQNLYGANGEIRMTSNDVDLSTVGSEFTNEITLDVDTSVGSAIFYMWRSVANGVAWSLEFDLYLYVNGERYI